MKINGRFFDKGKKNNEQKKTSPRRGTDEHGTDGVARDQNVQKQVQKIYKKYREEK